MRANAPCCLATSGTKTAGSVISSSTDTFLPDCITLKIRLEKKKKNYSGFSARGVRWENSFTSACVLCQKSGFHGNRCEDHDYKSQILTSLGLLVLLVPRSLSWSKFIEFPDVDFFILLGR